MIPQEVTNDFHEVLRHEMFEMNRSLAGVMAATQARLVARGLGQSGAMMQALAKDASNDLKARGQSLLGQLLRCLAAHGVTLDGENLKDATSLLAGAIQTEAHTVRSRLFSFPVFNVRGMDRARQQIQAEYDQEGPRLIMRLSTELKLAAAASRPRPAPTQAAPNFVFNAPVGLVQTGDGSQATVNQHINADVKTQIVSALQIYLEELEKPENSALASRPQLLELVAETKAEAEKPNGNTLKLGGSLRTIAETTKFVGSLGPAYQVLKPLLSFFGIHLP